MMSVSVRKRAPASIMMCDKHQLTIRYFCQTDNAVCCETCKITSHRTCDLVDIDSHSKQWIFFSIFKTTQTKLAALEEAFKSLKGQKKKDLAILKTKMDKCFEDVEMIRKDLNRVLDNLQAEIKQELRKVEHKLNKDMNSHLVIAENNLQKISERVSAMYQCHDIGNKEAIYIGIKKCENEIKEYEKIGDVLKNGPRPTEIKFSPDRILTSALTDLKSFGKIRGLDNDDEELCVLDLTPTASKRFEIGYEYVQSIVLMQDGHVLLACGSAGLKLFDKNFEKISELVLGAVSACKISEREVLVSQGSSKLLQFVKVFPKMIAKNVLITGKTSNGVCYHDGDIYVACHESGVGEIQVWNRNGELKRNIGSIEGQSTFIQPWAVQVNHDGSKVFVSDQGSSTVTCMDRTGDIIFRYSDKDLLYPAGLLIDVEDNLLACGAKSHNIHVITKTGKKQKVVKIESLRYPMCLSYSGKCLMIGVKDSRNLSLVTAKIN